MAWFSAIVCNVHPSDPLKDKLTEALAEKLAGLGVDTTVAGDIYHMPPEAPYLSVLREITGPLVVFSWLKSRAAFWRLAALGLTGRRVSAPQRDSSDAPERRPIACFDLAERCCADRWIEKVTEFLGERAGDNPGKLRKLNAEGLSERWFPVVDYERCNTCLDCLEFCLFGVYSLDDSGRVTVSSPEACKPGCPACSRVCPQQAIMFPLCEEDAVIAGADQGTVKPFDAETLARIEAARKTGVPPASAPAISRALPTVPDIERACGCKPKPAGQESARADKVDAGKADPYFDNLLDGLAKG